MVHPSSLRQRGRECKCRRAGCLGVYIAEHPASHTAEVSGRRSTGLQVEGVVTGTSADEKGRKHHVLLVAEKGLEKLSQKHLFLQRKGFKVTGNMSKK